MLSEAGGVKRSIVACVRTDLRKGIDGLAQLIGTKYDLNPFEKGTLFLFCRSRGDSIRGLLWEENEFLLFYISVLRLVPFPGHATDRNRRN